MYFFINFTLFYLKVHKFSCEGKKRKKSEKKGKKVTNTKALIFLKNIRIFYLPYFEFVFQLTWGCFAVFKDLSHKITKHLLSILYRNFV